MRLPGQLRYGGFVIFHPFKGFWSLKYEREGSLLSAFTILFFVTAAYILKRQYTGFQFNLNDRLGFNILVEIISVLLPFALWCASNWCLTTLMNGEGSMEDIIIASAYALIPLVLINFPLIPVSMVLTGEEAAFYYFFDTLSVVWSGFLMLSGTMTIHGYSMLKTVITSIFIIVGMGLIIFIGLLFFNVLQEMYSFVVVVYRELSFRL